MLDALILGSLDVLDQCLLLKEKKKHSGALHQIWSRGKNPVGEKCPRLVDLIVRVFHAVHLCMGGSKKECLMHVFYSQIAYMLSKLTL